MDYSENIPVNSIDKYLPHRYALICCASFEDRCCTLPTMINVSSVDKAYVVRNVDEAMKDLNFDNFSKICDKIKNISPIEAHFSVPVEVMEKLQEIFGKLVEQHETELVIDISTFTHEVLLMILKVLYINKNSFKSIRFVYNGASEYAPWLSKGCKEVRNILGYPGTFNPALKYHLIMLTGFELERATRLVELLEPDTLSIGIGKDPIEASHQKTMENFEYDFRIWMSNMQNMTCSQFQFSCSSIKASVSNLENIIKEADDKNIIIVPLNTKLSTIAAGLIALRYKRIQICYAIPEVYNISYSTPSEHFKIVNMSEIFKEL